MTDVLSQRGLNRATLARQHLLERAGLRGDASHRAVPGAARGTWGSPNCWHDENPGRMFAGRHAKPVKVSQMMAGGSGRPLVGGVPPGRSGLGRHAGTAIMSVESSVLGEVSAAAANRRRVGGIQDQITHYQRRVREDYLAPRRLTQELDLIQRLTG